MNLGTYFCVIFVLKMLSMDVTCINIINGEECVLHKIAKVANANETKNKYLIDNGFGVKSWLNSDTPMVTDLKDRNKIKYICSCFSFALLLKGKKTDEKEWAKAQPFIMGYMKFDTKYSYCVKFIEWIRFTTYCTPLVKCITPEEEFFIAESKASYEERKFRNMFIFKLNKKEKQESESNQNKVTYPMGDFIVALVQVDLDYFLVNEINLGKCQLNDIEKSEDSDAAQSKKLKDQFYSEYGFGVLNYIRLDWGPIASLEKKYIQSICYCFATVYSPYVVKQIKNSSEIGVETNFYYCKQNLFSGFFKKCPRSPVVQCTIRKEIFYLAESVKFYLSKGLRNIYLFTLDRKDLKYVEKTEGTEEMVINEPAGTFELLAPAVDLKKCFDPESIPNVG